MTEAGWELSEKIEKPGNVCPSLPTWIHTFRPAESDFFGRTHPLIEICFEKNENITEKCDLLYY